tara:strand:- start:14930 stop:15067 length:138 start_codon:yes stop_codon:yes gene_type:complete
LVGLREGDLLQFDQTVDLFDQVFRLFKTDAFATVMTVWLAHCSKG